MKCVLFILFCFLPWIARSAETENPSSDAGSVHVEPSSGGIEPGTVLTFTFPTSMIESANIDVPNQPWPFISQPEVEGEFRWKSPTEGEFRVKRVKAGAAYHFGLAPGLTDLAHQPVPAKDWSAEYKTPSFSITTDFEARHELSAQPQLHLESTYDVRLTEVVEHTYFQDRDSRQRFPVDVIQGLEDSAQAREFRVTPREPLPVARTYDLIVDGLVDAGSQEPLSYPGVFPVGTTAPLKIEWVGAFNRALEEPMIQIKFNDEFDPARVTPDKIRIEPAVGNLKLLADGQIVTARGDFDLTQHYAVTVFPDLKGQRGYALPVQSKWGATFHPKDPCLIFPSSQLFMRALKELHFSFLQVNTGPVEWKLARIPVGKAGCGQRAVIRIRTRTDQSAHGQIRGRSANRFLADASHRLADPIVWTSGGESWNGWMPQMGRKKPCARSNANRATASRFRAPIYWRQVPHRLEGVWSAIDPSFR